MVISTEFLLPLIYFRTCLENLDYLRIFLDCAQLEHYHPHVLSLVKGFDFTRTFPRLNKVSIQARSTPLDIPPGGITEKIVEQWSVAVTEYPSTDRAVNIKSLSLPHGAPSEFAAGVIVAMLPHVEILSVEAAERRTDLNLRWQYFWDLIKEIKVNDFQRVLCQKNVNLDSAFCGIFPQEVALLRECEEEYLRKVHIVPVMPSITCFKGLRTLELCCTGPVSDMEYTGIGRRTYLFSKVTSLVVFERCPSLSVTLTTYDWCIKNALEHLKPYVNVNFLRDRPPNPDESWRLN